MDYFSLDGLSGNLSTAKLIDRESLLNNNGIITLTVRVCKHLFIFYNIYFLEQSFIMYSYCYTIIYVG